MAIENTTGRDPMIHLLGAMSDGTGRYIEDMEAAGQQHLVNSDRLPTQANDGDDAYLAAGFTFGPAEKNDPLFRPATLPAGWKRQGSDHAMWSYIVDELDRRRVSIFYKAAFYDRDAFMRLNTVYGYASELAHDGKMPVFDDTWCTREAFAEAVKDLRDRLVERHDLYAGKVDEPAVPWAAEELAKVKTQLAEHDAWAAKAVTR